MSKLRQAAEQSLEALELYLTMDTVEESHLLEVDIAPKAITALRAALAEPEPRNQCGETCERAKLCAICAKGLEDADKAHALLRWVEKEMRCAGWDIRLKVNDLHWRTDVYEAIKEFLA